MDRTKLNAGIVIVSDTASQDPRTDQAFDKLSSTFEKEGRAKWLVTKRAIVPDDVLAIQRQVTQWSDGDEYLNLVITTGGTGFAVKDRTPEAISPLIHKHAPGLVHGMLAASLQKTQSLVALMSRPVAGVRNKTLIITLPGSPNGASENLEAVLVLLPHACEQAAGADSRALHEGGIKRLESQAGIISKQPSMSSGISGMQPTMSGALQPTHKHSHSRSHSHSHSHGHGGHSIPVARTKPEDRPMTNDPRAGPVNRYRESPYPTLSVYDALKIIFDKVPAPEKVLMATNTSIVGHVLAEDVRANEAVPAFRASIVDGYAVVLPESEASVKGRFPVVSVSHAAPGRIPALREGQVARITTGAPLPPGANAVAMVEDTRIVSTTDDGKEEKIVEILTDELIADENVREVGSDIQLNEVVLKANEEITSVGGEIGLLASVGRSSVNVYRKPTIGVLSTGDEIIPHTRPKALQLGEVRDCNRPTLMAAVSGWGYEVVDLGIAKDTPGALEADLRSAARSVDVIVTSGGVSMGELDLLKPTLERAMGGTIHFGRVAMKPGKPTTFATVPFKSSSPGGLMKRVPVFSLPGNPASALVTANLFVLPALQKMGGKPAPWGLPRMKVVAGAPVRCDRGRAEYHRVVLRAGEDGRMWAYSTGGQRSSKVGSLRGAQGLLCLPAREGVIGKGEMLEALVMGGFDGLI